MCFTTTGLAFPHQIDEFRDGYLSDGFLHAAQRLQRGAKAAGHVVARDGNEVVLATVQMQHQDVLYGVLSRVQQRDRIFTDVHLQIDLQGLICSRGSQRNFVRSIMRTLSEELPLYCLCI